MRGQQLSWQRRASRLGWVTAGLLLLSAVLLLLAGWALASDQPPVVPEPPLRAGQALLPVDVQIRAPNPVAALGLGLALSAYFVGLAALQTATAMRVLARDRRIPDPLPARAARMRRRVLGQSLVRALQINLPPPWPESGIPATAEAQTTLRCTVLVPAHDEEAVLAQTLISLARQTRPPDRVVVIADNCTDGTVRIAREHGVEVVETVDNTQKKAGALNQVLATLLPDTDAGDVVMVMDADSTISADFLATGLAKLEDDPDLMAVGGLFGGEDGGGVIGQLQRNEYARYQRVIGRREGRVFVMTGTGSLFRGYALRAVADNRGSLIPGTPGQVYDTLALTEDNELTLALKTLGARMVSPRPCLVTTEVMPTWRDLWRQRLRWQRGALENVGAYGLTRTTSLYWGQQLALGYGVIALNSYLALMTIALLAADGFRWSILWVGIGLLFLVERVVTAWRAGWRGRAIAVPLVIEVGYSLFLQATFVTSLLQIASGRKAGWNYVPRPAPVAAAAVPLLALTAIGARWNPLPSSVLQTTWFEALSLFVGLNTLVFAVLALFQLLPPIGRTWHRIQAGRSQGLST
ncbi:glycosyltransferase family 2 protein [Angustibacter sp. McL0619]|uniref:glycosyltransferase family 2 protein n=1 Tax=Angustibacter sp. McL0619 TaxID=3415676 RepID=UPI003CF36AED